MPPDRIMQRRKKERNVHERHPRVRDGEDGYEAGTYPLGTVGSTRGGDKEQRVISLMNEMDAGRARGPGTYEASRSGP